jgi:broad specificity phosphatase PhoE
VIYLRHGRTQYDQLQLERDHRALGAFDLARCDPQRELSNEGREELAQAGGQFRLASLPLDGVYTSR